MKTKKLLDAESLRLINETDPVTSALTLIRQVNRDTGIVSFRLARGDNHREILPGHYPTRASAINHANILLDIEKGVDTAALHDNI